MEVLKGSKTSIWMRNVQLGVFSCAIGLSGIYMNDYEKVAEGGFFQGYDKLTWLLVLVQVSEFAE